jgi:hypothetical protein
MAESISFGCGYFRTTAKYTVDRGGGQRTKRGRRDGRGARGDVVTERLNNGRRWVREEWGRRLALNAGMQTAA